ncbi:lipocalin family protein [Arcobacter arenosus]|uniref:lipocalin family protein n=1 Tax=Arcobacter arenosus TaxID=2576037 RepID=UPI003BACD09A
MIKKLILTVAIVFFVGCSTKYENLSTESRVDLNKYLGTWYEIARFEHFFEKGCKNVTANYSLLEDEQIRVINRCTKIESGEKKEAKGVAYSTDNTNSKLKVSFFRPFYGDYWIISLDENYKYALVGSPSREYLWILSRTKTIDEKIKKRLIDIAFKNGFDTSKFIWTIQE